MARSNPPLISFNAGELGEHVLARVDLQNYARGAEIMENIFPLVQGGMTKMPGTRYIADATGEGVLRPFVFSEEQKFAIELTASSLRLVFDNGIVTLPGAAATIGTWTDESATAPVAPSTPPESPTDPGDYDFDDFGGGSGSRL